ncbi:hypothetical protein FC62_GL000112 [Amylolactobacillus amylotrophicus DSM 20534]|uniref:Ribosome maturation factor RimP n=1 Tax=Amylolactobacillus amylotrophicus DSM 20534 TaxID=1423722 RepID=A0A0R1GVV6_9LACO|nr:hypothetical protein FC62_GL000112 [Amylolactobacillus amylotrophicus DSM 20534]
MLTLFIARKEHCLTEVVDVVKQAIQPIIDERGLELVDMEYVKEKATFYLRIYIDTVGGIDIEEIAAASELISEKLDELDPDPFPVPYLLEVSSPGIERPIKTAQDWQKALNSYIHVGLYQKMDQQKVFEGTLLAYDDEEISLQIKIKTRTKEIKIPRKNIAKIRFAIEF